jgi:hypothetical protein
VDVTYSGRILAVGISVRGMHFRIVQRDSLIKMIKASQKLAFAGSADTQGMMSLNDERRIGDILRQTQTLSAELAR